MVNPGDLDRKIIIQSKSEAQNSLGEVTYTWATYATVWAKVDMVSRQSGENFDNTQRIAEQSADFTIRYDNAITPDDYRISYNSKTWNIKTCHELTSERRKGFTVIFATYNDLNG